MAKGLSGRIGSRIVRRLRGLNIKYSDLFCSPDMQLERRLYRAKHPTRIIVFKCMDGRIHIPLATKIPVGILKIFRNLGANVNLGWCYASSAFDECIEYETRAGKKVLVLLVYHFSKGEEHRGCAGHDYDTKKAMASVMQLKEQIERIYGSSHKVVCPIVCGFETDQDALVLHGDIGKTLDLSTVIDSSPDHVASVLAGLFKKMPKDVLSDLVPLIQGNIRHIAEIKKKDRPIIDVEHKESVLAVGRGFDWLHEPNKALIIGPYQPNLDDVIRTGLRIIKSNFREGRIPREEGFVSLSSATFSSSGVNERRAIERAIFHRNMIVEIVEKEDEFSELRELMCPMAITTDVNTQKFKEV